jgi:hypothetical protein
MNAVRKSMILMGFSALAATVPGTGLSAATEQGNFRMSGVVSTVCRLEFAGPAASNADNVIDFGSFFQLCNARNGYRVTMLHPANMEGATLFWDGHAVPLSAGNETVIADENQAAVKQSDVRLDVRGVGVAVHSLSFRIEPKGSVF